MTPRDKLIALAGEASATCFWLGLPSAATAEIAGLVGPGLAVIDTEHGSIGFDTMAEMLRALRATPTHALVRVPDHAPAGIKRALDAGAEGVVVPSVEDADQARALARAALFPPAGNRGAAPAVIAATRYGHDGAYMAGWNESVLVAPQIESPRALANAAEIAAVEGVDMLFFGPYDYAMEAGLNPAEDGAALAEAFDRIVAAAKGAGKTAGVFPWPGVGVADLQAQGADLIAAASDIVVLTAGLRAAIGR